jgi:hypothetical protein
MATTLLDVIVVALWPLVFSAAVWAIAFNALAETDEITRVVQALTQPNAVTKKTKPQDVSLRRGNIVHKRRRRRLVSVSIQMRAAYSPQHNKSERPRDEKNTFARRWSLG